MKLRGRFFVLSLAFGAPALASIATAGPIAPAAFRDRLAAEISKAVGHPAVAIDDRTIKTTASDGTEFTVSIDNAYAAYVADETRLDEIVKRYAAILTMRAGNEPIDQLVVIVRPSDYLKRSLPAAASLDKFVPARPMAGDLSYFLAVDSSAATRTASKSDLARWHFSEAEAWNRGTANIKMRVGALSSVRLGKAGGASGFGADSGLAPSILADPAVCGPSAPNGIDGQVVLVASRDFFIYANPTDVGAFKAFWDAVREGVASGRSISATPLTCRGGRWVEAPAPQ